MSALLMGLVYHHQFSQADRDLLIALADNAKDDGSSCFPGVRYLAWKLGCTERNIQLGLRRLQTQGVLVPVAYLSGGRGMATVYQFTLDAAPAKPPFIKRGGDDILSPAEGEPPSDITVTPTSDDGAKVHAAKVRAVTLKGEGTCGKGEGTHTERVKVHAERVKVRTLKGEEASSPQPSYEPSYEPSEDEPSLEPSPAHARKPIQRDGKAALLLKRMLPEMALSPGQLANLATLRMISDAPGDYTLLAVDTAQEAWLRGRYDELLYLLQHHGGSPYAHLGIQLVERMAVVQ